MLIYGRTAASESKECGNVGAGAGRHVCDGEDGRVGINCEEASVARRDLASLERSSVATADLANLQHSLASFGLYSSFASHARNGDIACHDVRFDFVTGTAH